MGLLNTLSLQRLNQLFEIILPIIIAVYALF